MKWGLHHVNNQAILVVFVFSLRLCYVVTVNKLKSAYMFSVVGKWTIMIEILFLGLFFTFICRCLQNLKEDFVDYIAKKYGRNFRNRNSTILVVGN